MPSDLKALDVAQGHGEASLLQPGRNDESIVNERLIGALLDAKAALGADKVQQILDFARSKDLRFGEAAVALGLVTQDQVLHALSEQFGYAYTSEERRQLMPELVGLNQPFSMQAEAIREIRSQIMARIYQGHTGQPRPALAIVSPASGDGKTFFSANIAVSLAQVGGRTLLVDADLRGPRQHELFRLDNKTGLSSVLVGHVASDVIQPVPDVANLFVMPVGIAPPNPLELIERPAFGVLMRELAAKFDHVVVDTPAMQYGVDAQVIAARCGAALVVARKDQSRVAALQRLVAVLSQSPARVAGVILNEY
ncbi:MAG: polysaccharide biosynthesis tyrosine autokinase [Betaproteobacteria bacterium]|nr:polysaccharide biosynthesis tyrosine autokinase [Betaproteobacteria bacterium]MCC6248926.1 polysaccharide biosynthesis tyrosine autokinase [Rubrivivax sp.]